MVSSDRQGTRHLEMPLLRERTTSRQHQIDLKAFFNVLTVAWVGTICSNPPMCYISVRPERHSYPILKKNMEFVINLTTKDMAYATDWCGVRSGKDYNKFKEMHLTPGKASMVKAPIIEESPLCIECRVKEIISLGSHDMFIADVVNVKADDKYLNAETGKFDMEKANLLVYEHGGERK